MFSVKGLVVPHGSALSIRNDHERVGWVTDHNCFKALCLGEKGFFLVVSATSSRPKRTAVRHYQIMPLP